MNVMMFAHSGSLNRGCEAIVRSSAHILKSRISDCKINLVSIKPETDKIINDIDSISNGAECQFKASLIKKIRIYTELKLFKTESYAFSEIYKNTIERISSSDVVLSIGGDNYCYGEQPWLYEIDKRVKKKGKKLVLWACSIGEEDLSPRKIEDLRTFDLILARESLTFEMLKSKGLNNVKLCADPAFTMEKEELPLPEGWKQGDTIGLNFSPLILSKNINSISSVKQLIKHILDTTEAVIALTPHVIQEGNNDYEVLNDLYKEFNRTGRILILPDNLTAPQYKGYISRMRTFIAARTHASIAAYSSFVPTMVLGYSVKSRGIAKDLFGEEKLVLGINEISDKGKLINSFDEMLKEEQQIKRVLESVIPTIKELSYKSAEYLKVYSVSRESKYAK